MLKTNMMPEVVLDDDDPVYINVKKMPTFADLLKKVAKQVAV